MLDIKTAIPVQRYRYGEYLLTVLGEIESETKTRYEYVMAVMVDGEPEPGLYLAVEQNTGEGADQYVLRLTMRDGSQIIGQGNELGQLETFTREAFEVLKQLLNLSDETPYKLS